MTSHAAPPAAPSVNLSEDEVLERLEDYFSSGSFTTAIGKFAADHAHELEFAPITEEQPLKNFAVYRKYTAMIESHLQAFMEEHGIAPEELLERCRLAQQRGENALSCLDYVLASAEYGNFLGMMYDFAALEEAGGVFEDADEWDEAAAAADEHADEEEFDYSAAAESKMGGADDDGGEALATAAAAGRQESKRSGK